MPYAYAGHYTRIKTYTQYVGVTSARMSLCVWKLERAARLLRYNESISITTQHGIHNSKQIFPCLPVEHHSLK